MQTPLNYSICHTLSVTTYLPARLHSIFRSSTFIIVGVFTLSQGIARRISYHFLVSWETLNLKWRKHFLATFEGKTLYRPGLLLLLSLVKDVKRVRISPYHCTIVRWCDGMNYVNGLDSAIIIVAIPSCIGLEINFHSSKFLHSPRNRFYLPRSSKNGKLPFLDSSRSEILRGIAIPTQPCRKYREN